MTDRRKAAFFSITIKDIKFTGLRDRSKLLLEVDRRGIPRMLEMAHADMLLACLPESPPRGLPPDPAGWWICMSGDPHDRRIHLPDFTIADVEALSKAFAIRIDRRRSEHWPRFQTSPAYAHLAAWLCRQPALAKQLDRIGLGVLGTPSTDAWPPEEIPDHPARTPGP